MHAAIRWAVARQDTDTALRFVRAMGYYWVQRGYGEEDALCREVLAMTPPPLTVQLAEARVICAMLAAAGTGTSTGSGSRSPRRLTPSTAWAPTTRPSTRWSRWPSRCSCNLTAPPTRRRSCSSGTSHRATRGCARSGRSISPPTRSRFGRLDGAEDRCRAGLAELRALGEQWGVALALTMLAEFTELRADHAASVDTLTEAAALGRETGVWGDLGYVEGRLGVVYARAGDLDRGYAEIGKARSVMEARGGHVDSDRWVAFMLAELASRAGDYAEAARCCEGVLAAITDNAAPWWDSLRAQVKARMAVVNLRLGHAERCSHLLGEAVTAAAAWREPPALAAVLDACAVYVLSLDRPGAGGRAVAAEQAARLLGTAHGVRGVFDDPAWTRGQPARRPGRRSAPRRSRRPTSPPSPAAATSQPSPSFASCSPPPSPRSLGV